MLNNTVIAVEKVAAVICKYELELLQVPCVSALEECLFDEGLIQLTWCIENIMWFYQGI